MKKLLQMFILAAFLLNCPEMALAQPEPLKQVEIYLMPGVDVSRFQTVGKDPSVSIQPAHSWSVDKDDPFLRRRIREILLNSLTRQGFVLVDTADANLTVKVTITQWGRFRNSNDQNLMEYLDLEFRAYDGTNAEMILRAKGKYSRVDPLEETAVKVNEAFASILDEILASLRAKPESSADAEKLLNKSRLE